MEKEIIKVEPIVIYPDCIKRNGVQGDCHECSNKINCLSPRSMCINPYKDHKNGCPKFGKMSSCPPNIPCMYDQIFDISDVYAIITKINLYEYFKKRREKNPNLAEGQIRNLRVWQPISLKENDYAIAEFFHENKDKENFIATRLLECMGVDVVSTLKNAGLNISFPVKDYAYRVAFAAQTYYPMLEKYGFEIQEENRGPKRGMKLLVRK